MSNAAVRRHGRASLLGLLSQAERKTSWQLAEFAGDASPDGARALIDRELYLPGTWAVSQVGRVGISALLSVRRYPVSPLTRAAYLGDLHHPAPATNSCIILMSGSSVRSAMDSGDVLDVVPGA